MSESIGIESKFIPKIATGFCGGMSHTDGPCGALTGGVIAIGMADGRNLTTDDRSLTESKVQELVSTFKANYGSTLCYMITGCDLGTVEGQEKFIREGRSELCNSLVSFVTEKTIELINI